VGVFNNKSRLASSICTSSAAGSNQHWLSVAGFKPETQSEQKLVIILSVCPQQIFLKLFREMCDEFLIYLENYFYSKKT